MFKKEKKKASQQQIVQVNPAIGRHTQKIARVANRMVCSKEEVEV